MIDIIKDMPFQECETCECFEPEFRNTKMFGDDVCLVNEITVSCSNFKICREIRKQMKKGDRA